ncbi:MAG: ATP-binding cassette domain-containing protein [Chloroflexota bacterium]
MIKTEDLSKNFDGFWAVDGVTIDVPAGEVLALLGPNGAGKTTTVRMLTTILRPSRGSARLAGYDVLSQPEKVRRSVGVLTEQHGLYPRMTAQEYLDFFGRAYRMDSRRRKARIDELLDFFGLAADRHKRLGQYSKGMRQKLALARALLHDPPVLLLDEPTSAMDPASARLVRNAILQLRSAERAVILCTHNLSEAEELADQIAIIRQGKMIAQGSVQQLKHAFQGTPRYRITFTPPIPSYPPPLPEGVNVVETAVDGLTFETEHPQETNPQLLRLLLRQGFNVYRLEEVERSLEEVYLQTVHGSKEAKE